MTLPIAPLLSTFLNRYLPEEKGASPATIAAYSDCYLLLLRFAARRLGVAAAELNVEHLDAALVLDFLSHIEAVRKNSAKSRNARLAAIRSLMAYIADQQPSLLEHVRRTLAIPVKKTDSKLITALSEPEMRALLDAPDTATAEGIRDRAMLLLACNAGLRVSELLSLEIQDVDLRADPQVRTMGKGRKERVLPLWKQTADAIRAWLTVRGAPRSTTLFVNARGQVMTRWGFDYVLQKHVVVASRDCPSIKSKL